MTILEQLGELVAHGEPDAGERDRVRLHVIDSIAAWIAASESEEGARVLRLGGSGQKPVLFGDDPLDEIVRRVAVTRASEIDDIHMPSCVTAGALIAPTALILARSCAATPRAFLAAVWAGYEVATRLGVAIQGAKILYRGIWPTYFLAPVATAAVAARLLRLDPLSCANALAGALAMASGGIGAPADHLARFLHAGFAARAGATAALAAREGLIADRTLLDGDWLARVHGIELDPGAIAPSAPSRAMREISIKPYCAAKQTIAAIDGFRTILKNGRSADDIGEVRVTTPPAYAKMIGHHDCARRVGRITSLPYQLALAALRPDLLTEVKRTDLSGDPKIAAFMRRVSVAPDEALAAIFPRVWPARVEVRLTNGDAESILAMDAEGDPARPLGAAEIAAKFRVLTDPVLGSDEGARLLAACNDAFESEAELHTLLTELDSLALRLREQQTSAVRRRNTNGARS